MKNIFIELIAILILPVVILFCVSLLILSQTKKLLDKLNLELSGSKIIGTIIEIIG